MNIQKKLEKISGILVSVALLAILGISSTQADEVVFDDLIVDGSACIGLDCVEGQDFSFSTLILQENNLRVFLNDTSTSASFPANDWEIIANDSANGGDSFLGFADRLAGQVSVSGEGICSGGDSNGLVCGDVPENNCLGICDGDGVGGTCSFDTDCWGTCTGTSTQCISDENCGVGGVCEKTAICDGPGMCVAPGAVVFLIEAGAPADSLKIDSLGMVGLGTGTPEAELDVNGDAIVRGNLTVTGTIGGGTGAPQMCPEKEFVVGVEANGTIICAAKNK
jgi:hypothetical protein